MADIEKTPPGWGVDSLSNFINVSIQNTFAVFVRLPNEYQRLLDIDTAYLKITGNLTNSPDWFSIFFLYHAHSAFRGSARMALSGQTAETYALLRCCLESTLYGLYVSKNPDSQEIWLRRNDDEKCKSQCKSMFTIKNVQECLKDIDTKLFNATNKLYNKAIDWGGHPNERALFQNLAHTAINDQAMNIRYDYLSAGELPHILCMKRTAQVGVCSLKIFRYVFSERFDILGISEMITAMEQGL